MRLPPRLRAELARLTMRLEQLDMPALTLRQALRDDDPLRVTTALIDAIHALLIELDRLRLELDKLAAENEELRASLEECEDELRDLKEHLERLKGPHRPADNVRQEDAAKRGDYSDGVEGC